MNKQQQINIKPLQDRVVVQPAQAQERTKSGIYIPDTAQKKPQQGEVVAVGPGKKEVPMTLKVGDKILYGQYGGTEIALDGEKYLIMAESDVYAVL